MPAAGSPPCASTTASSEASERVQSPAPASASPGMVLGSLKSISALHRLATLFATSSVTLLDSTFLMELGPCITSLLELGLVTPVVVLGLKGKVFACQASSSNLRF